MKWTATRLRRCAPVLLVLVLPAASSALLFWRPPPSAAAPAAVPAYSIADRSVLVVDGQRWLPLDENGVFYVKDPGASSKVPMPKLDLPLADILRDNGWWGLTRCEPTDFIDGGAADHDFRDSAGVPDAEASRVWTYKDRPYRVAPTARKLTWFSHVVKTSGRAGEPHLLVAELPNDRERYTTLSITLPRLEPWAPPYAGVEPFVKDAVDKTMSPDGHHPDVGGGIYTGREYPCDGRVLLYPLLFHSRTTRVKLTVSHYRAEQKDDADNGAAVGRVWVFRVVDALRNRAAAAPVVPDLPERHVGIYQTHPWYFFGQYGHPPQLPAHRAKSLQTLVDHLRFCGMNLIQYNAVNGSDRTARAWYDSKLFRPCYANLLAELTPIAEKDGMWLLPVVTTLFLPKSKEASKLPPDKPTPEGFSRLTFQWDRDGSTPEMFGSPSPDPLRPEVQGFLIQLFKEILDRCGKKKPVIGVGFRVNGKFGLCYAGEGERCGQDRGYSPWDLAEFQKEAGVRIPPNAQSCDWLKANAWEKWIAWRCKRMHTFWGRARDVVRTYRKDLRLWVDTDLPSENPGSTIEFARGEAPLEILRHHGYDPRLFTKEAGLVIQRVMMIGADRYFGAWGGEPPPARDAAGYKTFHYAPGVAELYRTAEPSAVELYYNYWEESPHPDGEFGGTMRTGNVTPPGRAFFEAACFSLRRANVQTVAFMGWERPTLGHEPELRQWCRAFRALPAVEPKAFEGKVDPAEETLWVRWFGPRLAVMNDNVKARTATLTLKLPEGKTLVDVSTGNEVPVTRKGEEATAVMPLRAWDLRALEVR